MCHCRGYLVQLVVKSLKLLMLLNKSWIFEGGKNKQTAEVLAQRTTLGKRYKFNRQMPILLKESRVDEDQNEIIKYRSFLQRLKKPLRKKSDRKSIEWNHFIIHDYSQSESKGDLNRLSVVSQDPTASNAKAMKTSISQYLRSTTQKYKQQMNIREESNSTKRDKTKLRRVQMIEVKGTKKEKLSQSSKDQVLENKLHISTIMGPQIIQGIESRDCLNKWQKFMANRLINKRLGSKDPQQNTKSLQSSQNAYYKIIRDYNSQVLVCKAQDPIIPKTLKIFQKKTGTFHLKDRGCAKRLMIKSMILRPSEQIGPWSKVRNEFQYNEYVQLDNAQELA